MSDGMAAAELGLAVARELIPARVRRTVYAGGSLTGYGLAAVSVGFVAAGSDVPSWVAVALAVLGSLMGPLGQLAATNVPATAGAVALLLDDGEDSAVDLPPDGFDVTDDDTLDDAPEQMELGPAETAAP